MRQRKAKDLDTRLARCSRFMIEGPFPVDGQQVFGNDKDLYVEIGCGKGDFIIKKALENPGSNFIAIEGQGTVILRAMEKLEGLETPPANLRFICDFVNGMDKLFSENQLAGVYLNFSDPWPKARHRKRRLTYRDRLRDYAWALRDGGFMEFKTDNDGLYEFTLEEIRHVGYEIIEETRDLHSSDYQSQFTTTEYEDKFRGRGKNINYVKFVPGK